MHAVVTSGGNGLGQWVAGPVPPTDGYYYSAPRVIDGQVVMGWEKRQVADGGGADSYYYGGAGGRRGLQPIPAGVPRTAQPMMAGPAAGPAPAPGGRLAPINGGGGFSYEATFGGATPTVAATTTTVFDPTGSVVLPVGLAVALLLLIGAGLTMRRR